jgi:hypothetical protein
MFLTQRHKGTKDQRNIQATTGLGADHGQRIYGALAQSSPHLDCAGKTVCYSPGEGVGADRLRAQPAPDRGPGSLQNLEPPEWRVVTLRLVLKRRDVVPEPAVVAWRFARHREPLHRGLREGERVIVHPSNQIEDGSRVVAGQEP